MIHFDRVGATVDAPADAPTPRIIHPRTWIFFAAWVALATAAIVTIVQDDPNITGSDLNWTNLSYGVAAGLAFAVRRWPAGIALAFVCAVSWVWHDVGDINWGAVDSWGAHVAIVYLILSLALPYQRVICAHVATFLVTICQIPSRTSWTFAMEMPIVGAVFLSIVLITTSELVKRKYSTWIGGSRYVWKDIFGAVVLFGVALYIFYREQTDHKPQLHGMWHVLGGAAAGMLVTAERGAPVHVLGLITAKQKYQTRLLRWFRPPDDLPRVGFDRLNPDDEEFIFTLREMLKSHPYISAELQKEVDQAITDIQHRPRTKP